ncbi:MAG: asparaginase [Synergistetes bacterium]|nr:asparaginase [Synergistota bacterium]
MKRILWVRTGGTIDMIYDEASDSYVPAPKDMIKTIVDRIVPADIYLEIRSDVIEFIDSSEMIPQIWVDLAKFVGENIESYDGILITHGTDTMHYTSAALSFMLRNLNKPVVLTGSMIPILEEGSDGVRNFLDSLTFLTKVSIGGVFLVFDGKIISGVRARKISSSDFGAFVSVNSEYVGYIENGIVNLNSKKVGTSSKQSEGAVYAETNLDNSVALIKLFPGFKPKILEDLAEAGIKGIVLESFGSGGARVTEPLSLIDAIKKLRERGIPVFVTSQCYLKGVVRFGPKPYYVAKRLMEAGAVSLHDMLSEVAVVKLMWVLGRVSAYDEIINMMLTNFAGEIKSET